MKRKLFTTIANVTPIFFTVVATIAIIWNYATTYDVAMSNWWFLPMLVGVTGLSATILPRICTKFKPLYSVIATGCTLFFMEIPPLVDDFSLLFIISFFLEITLYRKRIHIGDILFDFLCCIFASFVLNMTNIITLKLLILLILYLIILIVDFHFNLNFKKYVSSKNESKKEEAKRDFPTNNLTK